MPRGVAQADEPDLSADTASTTRTTRSKDTLEVIWTPDVPQAPPAPEARTREAKAPERRVPQAPRAPAARTPGRRASRQAGVLAPTPAPHPSGSDADDHLAAKSAPEELRDLLHQLKAEHRRRRSVRYGRMLTAAVALGLLGVWLLNPPNPAGNENRAEVSFPKLDGRGIGDASAFRQADAALRDRLALREYVVTAIGDAAKNKLGVSLSPQVVLGDGGTPFIAEDFTLPCEHSFDAAQVDRSLEALRAIGARTGKTITVAVAPDKSAVLTNQLGRVGSALMSCSNRVRASTQREWGGSDTAPVVTMWNQMSAIEATEPGQVYQHGDTHWTSRGALVFSQAVIRQLIAQGEAPASLAGAPQAVRAADRLDDADLYRMMGTPRQEEVPVWLVSRKDVKVTGQRLDTPSGRGMPVYHAEPKTPNAPLITGRTLIIHDSFFARAEPQLAPFFSDLTVMHWADFITDVNTGTLPEFDRIIIETVQRGWAQRAGWIDPGQSTYQALAAGLATPHS